MTRPEAALVAVLVGSLFALAIFVEPIPALVRLFGRLVAATDATIGWTRAWLHRGRHHVHAPLPARPFERDRITVAQLAHRMAGDVEFFDWRAALNPNHFRALPEQLGGLSA